MSGPGSLSGRQEPPTSAAPQELATIGQDSSGDQHSRGEEIKFGAEEGQVGDESTVVPLMGVFRGLSASKLKPWWPACR